MKVPATLKLEFILPHEGKIECEAEIKDNPAGWRQRRGYGNNCQRHAAYRVGEKKFCRMHAGAEVLDILYAAHPTHFYRVSNIPAVQMKPK